MNTSVKHFGLLAAGLIGLTTLALAQQPAAQSPTQQQSVPAAGQSRMQNADATLATWLAIDNQNEITEAHFAKERSQNEQVRKFADMLISDHTQMLRKLQQFAGNTGFQVGSAQATPSASDQVAANQNDLQTRGGNVQRSNSPAMPNMRAGLDFMALKQELAAKCLQSHRQELSQKQGAEFDQCYIGMQIAAHMHALDTMEVFQGHVSSELRQTLADGTQTVRMHLDHAKQLMRELAQAK